jgi:hypothetical protein
MYIVARSRRINQARGRAALGAAVEAGGRGSELIGLPVFTWTSVFSADGPAVSWTARVEHLADAIAADDAMGADDGFAQWAEGIDELFEGPTSDQISQVVHNAPDGPPKNYVQVTRAQCANGSLTEGMAVAVEIADAATQITGVSLMVVVPVSGAYGAVGWISSVDDLAEVEAASAALAADVDWLKLVDRAGHAFAPGASSSMLRRIG